MEVFKFGVKGLDELLVNALIEGQLLIIAGHPGAGKTTLVSTICYVNALNGYKCLYLSLQESREKLYMNMKRLGIDLEKVEKDGYFKYIKIPLIVTEDAVMDIFMDTVNKSIEEFRPRIVVVDSITPVLKATQSSVKARAILQNFFAELPKLINGIVVLIAEIPLGKEEVELGDIEFVSDMIITLKHRVEKGLLTRIMEIRKSRGSPLTLVEVPFSIREGYGIEAWVSPRLEEIIEIENPLEIPCDSLKEALRYINKGDVIYWEYPSYMRSGGIGLLIQLIAVANKLKTLYISYKHAPSSMYNILFRLLERHGVGKEVV
ncbi:MAG: ATPase domain-containing protein, partial [Desulfurococcaceae archaeon]